jgi:hypothetical protein
MSDVAHYRITGETYGALVEAAQVMAHKLFGRPCLLTLSINPLVTANGKPVVWVADVTATLKDPLR